MTFIFKVYQYHIINISVSVNSENDDNSYQCMLLVSQILVGNISEDISQFINIQTKVDVEL